MKSEIKIAVPQQTIEEFVQPALNQPIWNVRQFLTTAIDFEVGKKVGNRGEFNFSIESGYWWLKKGQDRKFEDIVSSGSTAKNIESKIQVLEGKKLLHIQFNSEGAVSFFDFEDDLFLELVPVNEKEPSNVWSLLKGNEALVILSDGTYLIKDANSSEKPSPHELKKLARKSQAELDRVKNLILHLAEQVQVDVSADQFDEAEGRKFFMYVVNEFRTGVVSVDDLSLICELMYKKFFPNSEIYRKLRTAGEIEWEIRNTPIGACYAISELMEFFR